MKVILDIKDNRVPFFMELLKSLDYINILKEVKDLKEVYQASTLGKRHTSTGFVGREMGKTISDGHQKLANKLGTTECIFQIPPAYSQNYLYY